MCGFVGIHTAAMALPPYAVTNACKKALPIKSMDLTMTPLMAPGGTDTPETHCYFKYEYAIPQLKYGTIECHHESYLLLNGQRFKFKTAQNHSQNLSITPGNANISSMTDWWKIDYQHQSFLCLVAPLSDSGEGATHMQYYIVEHAFDNQQPLLHYYFFDKQVKLLGSLGK